VAYFPEKQGLLSWDRRTVIGWALALALVLGGGLALAVSSQAKTKPKHHALKSKSHTLKCRAGYVRRFVKVPKRKHGRIVRVHRKIVYVRVQRCVKVSKATPKPKPPTTTTPGPPTTTTPGSPSPVVPPPSSSPPPVAPANTTLPQVSGTTRAGQTLSATPGTWTGRPAPSFAYQWQRCDAGGGSCQNVAGNAGSYLLGTSDVGSTLRVSVRASNTAGSGSAVSALTAVIASSSDPVAVAVGDIACAPGDTTNSCQQSATASLAAAQHPTAVLPLGDNQYNSGLLSEYTGAYALTWGMFNPIAHPAPGNHEYTGSAAAAGYFSYFGSAGALGGSTATTPYYSYNLGTWHIVSLDSSCGNSGCGDLVQGDTTSAQTAWLQSDLAAHPSACTLAYWHHPRFSQSWTNNSPATGPLFSALYNAHADIVLSGHDHVYERYAQLDPTGAATGNGVREFVAGTGGENLFGPSTTPQPPTPTVFDDTHFGVLVLTLHATSYDWAFKGVGGTVLDSGSTACHGGGGGSPAALLARDARAWPVGPTGPALSLDARLQPSSVTTAERVGVPVAIHMTRAADVTVTVSRRRGHRLTRIASFYETESQIPGPHSRIFLRLPAARLAGARSVGLVVRFSAIDAANHHRTVTRIVTLKRR
jgi:hypothetical protein